MAKLSNRTFVHSFLKMAPLGRKFTLFCTCGKPQKSTFYAIWHHFISREKKSYLYFLSWNSIFWFSKCKEKKRNSLRLLNCTFLDIAGATKNLVKSLTTPRSPSSLTSKEAWETSYVIQVLNVNSYQVVKNFLNGSNFEVCISEFAYELCYVDWPINIGIFP